MNILFKPIHVIIFKLWRSISIKLSWHGMSHTCKLHILTICEGILGIRMEAIKIEYYNLSLFSEPHIFESDVINRIQFFCGHIIC